MLRRSLSKYVLSRRRLSFYYRRVDAEPHPDKRDSGGEDAYLSLANAQVVLDGVSWWRDKAHLNAGLYSDVLARRMYEYIEEDLLGDVPKTSLRLLERAYRDCKHAGVEGTCTALVATLQELDEDVHLKKDGYYVVDYEAHNSNDSGGPAAASSSPNDTSEAAVQRNIITQAANSHFENNWLDVAHLGDCSLMLIRAGKVLYVTEDQQHDLDFPYQLGSGSKDKPADSVKLLLPVQKGDIVLIGSDGLFDNLYPHHIAELLWSSGLDRIFSEYHYLDGGDRLPRHRFRLDRVSARRSQIVEEMMQSLMVGATLILREAVEVSGDIRCDTPYASKCIENGAMYEGGKPDDITLLTAIIGEEDDEENGDRVHLGESLLPLPYRNWP